MSRRWIGITTYRREREGRERVSLPTAYVDAVRAVGGIAVLLAPGAQAPDQLLARLDGLVLSGGGDVDPRLSGATGHASVYGSCVERDQFEIGLAGAAMAQGVPTLAICRGLQIVNVARGGTLHAHLPDIVGGRVEHRASQREAAAHPVQVDAGSKLAAQLDADALASVPSWHHQAIDRLGAGLRPVAWAADGVIEAIEVEGAPALTAIQWHPELDLSPTSPSWRLLRRLTDA